MNKGMALAFPRCGMGQEPLELLHKLVVTRDIIPGLVAIGRPLDRTEGRQLHASERRDTKAWNGRSFEDDHAEFLY